LFLVVWRLGVLAVLCSLLFLLFVGGGFQDEGVADQDFAVAARGGEVGGGDLLEQAVLGGGRVEVVLARLVVQHVGLVDLALAVAGADLHLDGHAAGERRVGGERALVAVADLREDRDHGGADLLLVEHAARLVAVLARARARERSAGFALARVAGVGGRRGLGGLVGRAL